LVPIRPQFRTRRVTLHLLTCLDLTRRCQTSTSHQQAKDRSAMTTTAREDTIREAAHSTVQGK
jgi:hypothetical protein